MKKISILLTVCILSAKAGLNVQNNTSNVCSVSAIPTYIHTKTNKFPNISVLPSKATIPAHSKGVLKEALPRKDFTIGAYTLIIKCGDHDAIREMKPTASFTIDDSTFST